MHSFLGPFCRIGWSWKANWLVFLTPSNVPIWTEKFDTDEFLSEIGSPTTVVNNSIWGYATLPLSLLQGRPYDDRGAE